MDVNKIVNKREYNEEREENICLGLFLSMIKRKRRGSVELEK